MHLYLSTATSYNVYNKLLSENLIAGGYQSQRFNYNVITGLSKFTKVVSLSSLPYVNTDAQRLETTEDDVEYICLENRKGIFHKFFNVKNLIQEGKNFIKNNEIQHIICDAVSLSPAIATLFLSKFYKIPSVAIVTDIMEASPDGVRGFTKRLCSFLMKRFDYYVLLTESMNDIVNPKKRPYVVMEGSCDVSHTDYEIESDSLDKNICLYGGALWKKNAGIEYFIEGFIKANIPNTELHLYGTGELKEDIISISAEHSQVKYMGCITNQELAVKQREAALLVNPRPSDNEFSKYSFPSKTFEYMASGTPVLMTRLPGIPDEYYKFVYAIEEENSDFICKKLKDIFSLPESERKKTGADAKNFVSLNKNNVVQSKKIFDFLNSQSF